MKATVDVQEEPKTDYKFVIGKLYRYIDDSKYIVLCTKSTDDNFEGTVISTGSNKYHAICVGGTSKTFSSSVWKPFYGTITLES
jgi:hypothetical protein